MSIAPPTPSWIRHAGWIAPALLAAGALATGLLLPAERWAQIFQTDLAFPDAPHADRPTALAGASLLRVMLFVTAATVLACAAIWRKTDAPPSKRDPADEVSSRELWIIVGLVALGLAMRLPRLGESLWFDEIAAWRDYGMRGPGWIVGTYYDPANHILHSLLTWCSERWLGFDGFALRAPALVFSLAAIVPVYFLGRAVSSPRVGYFAGALMALAPVAALEGVESRGYSMMIFFAAMQTWLLLIGWRRSSGLVWFAYALCAALGVWAHLTTVFVTLGHGAWVAWRTWRDRDMKRLLAATAAFGCAAIFTLTLYAPVLPQMLEIRATFATVEGNEPRLTGPEGVHALLQLGGSWYWWAALPGLVLATLGVYRARADEKARRTLAMALLGLPLMVLFVALGDSWLYARFTLFALPGAVLAMALGLDVLWRMRRPLGFVALALVATLAASDISLRPPKQPLRNAMDAIRDSGLASGRGIAIGLTREFDLYTVDLDVTASPFHGRDLAELLPHVQPAWIVLDYPNSVSDETYELLRLGGYDKKRVLRGWADWTNGDVVIYTH